MGGGDLNLKKSWHPHTMKNQEKVWKAEQAKNEEERKLNDLRKEIEEERNREDLKRRGQANGVLNLSEGDKKLEWMYKNSTELINREEYLLGRSVDKSFEMLQAEEQRKEHQNTIGVKQPLNHVEHECVPFSIRAYKNVSSTEQVDLQRKVMEDPLMLIKQREMESRRKILENPVKLKELHRILKTDQLLKKIKKSKKSKKSKKPKKKHKQHRISPSDSDSDISDDNLDRKLAKKLKGNLLDKETDKLPAGLDLTKLLNAKYKKISKELDKAVGVTKKRHRSSKKSHRKDEDTNEEDTDTDCGGRRREKSRKRHHSRSRSRSRSPKGDIAHSKQQKSSRRVARSRSKSAEVRYDSKRHSRSRLASRERQEKVDEERRKRPNESSAKRPTKISEEEKEARRREMMENAAWREEDRTRAVQRHREANAREEAAHKAQDFDKDFLNKEIRKAIANQTSVGSRIRSNLNNIQRTAAAMNSNFAQK